MSEILPRDILQHIRDHVHISKAITLGFALMDGDYLWKIHGGQCFSINETKKLTGRKHETFME